MKILIALEPDPSEPVAIADLRRAGFPAQCNVLVVSVADVLPPPTTEAAPSAAPPLPAHVQAALDRARATAADAQAQLQTAFPTWTIAIEAIADAPAWGIIRKAESWRPDVIVVGAHRQSALSRLVLGSVSQKVLHTAPGTIRIVKRGTIDTYRPPRLLIGIDGSQDAEAAVAAVAARQWPASTAVHLVAVLAPALDTGTTPASREAGARVRIDAIARQLADRGLTLSTAVLDGDPTEALLAEAATWNADCIFIGARGLRVIERLVLGSVSAALATRATCSVEVVRPLSRT